MNVTKGNWEAVENDHFIDIKVDGNPIAHVFANQYVDTGKKEMQANARMMAASKEMLERLSKANDEIAFLINIYNKKVKDPANFIDAETCHENQLFIAKVKGEL